MKLKMILGLCFAVAMLVSAIAAQGASAQTAVACAPNTETGKEQFSDNHCTTAATGNGGFKHVTFTGSTAITGSGGVTKLKSVSSGVELELQSTEVTGSGTMENKEEAGVMFAHGTGKLRYFNVTVTKPAGLGCEVKSDDATPVVGQVVTKELTATTKNLTNELSFVPVAVAPNNIFASFTVFNCSTTPLNHLYSAKGSVKGQTSGATTKFTHANTTAQGTLTLQGQLAGIEGELTIKGANGNGLALT
jgi:hypothetical protein